MDPSYSEADGDVVALERLRDRWAIDAGRRDALAKEAQGRVSTWVWMSGGVAHEPYLRYAERHGVAAGTMLDGPPKDLAGVNAYGYDERGRIVAAKLFESDDRYGLVVFVDEMDERWHVRFNDRGEIGRVGRTVCDDGRPTVVEELQLDHWGRATWWRESYLWRDGRLVEVRRSADEEDAPEDERARMRAGSSELLEYDEHGALSAIRFESRSGGTAPYYTYRADARRGSLQRALRRFEASLVTAVRLAVERSARPKLGAICLVYDAEFPIPPTLALCSVDELAALRADDSDPEHWLNPTNWSEGEVPLPFAASGLDIADLAGWVTAANDQAKAHKALSRAARQLASAPPPSSHNPDHLLVFTVDSEMETLQDALKGLPALRRLELGL